MEVKPEEKYVADDGVELKLEGGKELKGYLHCNGRVRVKVCRVNNHMHLNFPELLLDSCS